MLPMIPLYKFVCHRFGVVAFENTCFCAFMYDVFSSFVKDPTGFAGTVVHVFLSDVKPIQIDTFKFKMSLGGKGLEISTRTIGTFVLLNSEHVFHFLNCKFSSCDANMAALVGANFDVFGILVGYGGYGGYGLGLGCGRAGLLF